LEDRTTPASVTFVGGALLIDASHDAARLVLDLRMDVRGYVANGGQELRDQAGRAIRAGDVRSIEVQGSRFGDWIDLHEIDTRGFRGLDGRVTVYANGGNDQVQGSAFADQLHGGGGDDLLSGLGGNDWLYGDGDNDDLKGGDGDDHLFGGDGNDHLLGGAGRDYFYGGTGSDTVYDYSPWLDSIPAGDVERR
jgi:Ca2+-binding RTX toxin-like protein